ncbi:MAG: UDP-N-acetylglucosamine 4,6-dehydratase (inverting) [Alphaproteobacteria bacterium]|nr:UDP-N-acetylglucosamine 4,6-dehydratase (inverting) [Alphaproteobacteria bacterium]
MTTTEFQGRRPIAGTAVLRDFRAPRADFDGKTVLITGGTGSFGQEFVRRVLADYTPERLIVFSRDELKQYEMEQSYPVARYPCLRYFIGDVRDYERLELAMRDVDVVVHAAAMKHVPAAEYNPFECIKTNVHGAENVVRAAIKLDVDRIIALSTDKAANPINLYGASKLASDKIFVAANNLVGRKRTRFSIVRYGNVVGSRGSVVPHFRNLLRNGSKTVPITDPRMTRFWMTIGQGVAFVQSCLAMMVGGEIFVPKIPSMSIMDLAAAIVPELETEIVGIRPGEKLHEVLIPTDDARHTLELEDRFVVTPSFNYWSEDNHATGEPVDEVFTYASNMNDELLDSTQLRELLSKAL